VYGLVATTLACANLLIGLRSPPLKLITERMTSPVSARPLVVVVRRVRTTATWTSVVSKRGSTMSALLRAALLPDPFGPGDQKHWTFRPTVWAGMIFVGEATLLQEIPFAGPPQIGSKRQPGGRSGYPFRCGPVLPPPASGSHSNTFDPPTLFVSMIQMTAWQQLTASARRPPASGEHARDHSWSAPASTAKRSPDRGRPHDSIAREAVGKSVPSGGFKRLLGWLENS
jgi:hypothetical protein